MKIGKKGTFSNPEKPFCWRLGKDEVIDRIGWCNYACQPSNSYGLRSNTHKAGAHDIVTIKINLEYREGIQILHKNFLLRLHMAITNMLMTLFFHFITSVIFSILYIYIYIHSLPFLEVLQMRHPVQLFLPVGVSPGETTRILGVLQHLS